MIDLINVIVGAVGAVGAVVTIIGMFYKHQPRLNITVQFSTQSKQSKRNSKQPTFSIGESQFCYFTISIQNQSDFKIKIQSIKFMTSNGKELEPIEDQLSQKCYFAPGTTKEFRYDLIDTWKCKEEQLLEAEAKNFTDMLVIIEGHSGKILKLKDKKAFTELKQLLKDNNL